MATIIANSGSSGTISPIGTVTVVNGEDQEFTITPNAGYRLATLMVDGEIVVDGAEVSQLSSYTMENVTGSHTIDVIFSLIPVNPATTNMYEDVERSIWKTLEDAMLSMGVVYPVFNNLVSKKDFPAYHAAISVMKISDIPNYANGGGTKASLKTVKTKDANDNPLTYNVEPWPQFFDLLYQLVVNADTLDAARTCDLIIRRALFPHRTLRIFNSATLQWSSTYLNTSYAGYINRDIPTETRYWRVTNYRVEVPDYTPEYATEVPAMNDVVVGVATVEPLYGSVDLSTL